MEPKFKSTHHQSSPWRDVSHRPWNRERREWKIARFRASRFVSGLRIAWRFAFQTFNRIRLTGNKCGICISLSATFPVTSYGIPWDDYTSFVLFHHVVKLIRLFTLVTFSRWNLWRYFLSLFSIIREGRCSNKQYYEFIYKNCCYYVFLSIVTFSSQKYGQKIKFPEDWKLRLKTKLIRII